MAKLRTLIKREESYGIHALLAVAENPGISAAEVAQKLQVPPAFLAKVMRKLAKAGLIESRTGRGGGVWLKTDPQQVSLLSVIEALSGPVVMDTCQTQPKCATEQRRGHCNLKPVWILGSLEIREILERFTLDQIIEKPG